MGNNDLPLLARFTVLVDFLGASNAARWPKERLYPFLDLLISIAHVQSVEEIAGSPQEDGSYRIRFTTCREDKLCAAHHLSTARWRNAA